eukprot:g2970.t1
MTSLFTLATTKLTIIDVRASSEFIKSHVVDSFNIPFTEIKDRKYELPPRYVVFFVIVGKEELCTAQNWFLKQPFDIEGFLIWEYIEKLPITTGSGVVRHCNVIKCGHKYKFPFQACPLLNQEIEFLKMKIKNNNETHIIDLGCGSGRDTIFMAKHFDKANILAVDNLPGKIQQVLNFTKNYNINNVIPIEKDVRKNGSLFELYDEYNSKLLIKNEALSLERANMRNGSDLLNVNNNSSNAKGFSIVIISRFLCRDVFQEIFHLLNVGGILCIHSFLTCNIKPKKMKDKIDAIELKNIFGTQGFGMKILRNNNYIQPIDGRQLTMFLAMKV